VVKTDRRPPEGPGLDPGEDATTLRHAQTTTKINTLRPRRLTAGVCIIHLIRNTFRLASRRDWDRLKRDVKLIYTAPNEPSARSALDELTEAWGARYPAIVRLWENAWAEFIPFLDYTTGRSAS